MHFVVVSGYKYGKGDLMIIKLKLNLTDLSVESNNDAVTVHHVTQEDSTIEIEISTPFVFKETPYQAIINGYNNISPIG
jgi:hypothetical protein